MVESNKNPEDNSLLEQEATNFVVDNLAKAVEESNPSLAKILRDPRVKDYIGKKGIEQFGKGRDLLAEVLGPITNKSERSAIEKVINGGLMDKAKGILDTIANQPVSDDEAKNLGITDILVSIASDPEQRNAIFDKLKIIGSVLGVSQNAYRPNVDSVQENSAAVNKFSEICNKIADPVVSATLKSVPNTELTNTAKDQARIIYDNYGFLPDEDISDLFGAKYDVNDPEFTKRQLIETIRDILIDKNTNPTRKTNISKTKSLSTTEQNNLIATFPAQMDIFNFLMKLQVTGISGAKHELGKSRTEFTSYLFEVLESKGSTDPTESFYYVQLVTACNRKGLLPPERFIHFLNWQSETPVDQLENQSRGLNYINQICNIIADTRPDLVTNLPRFMTLMEKVSTNYERYHNLEPEQVSASERDAFTLYQELVDLALYDPVQLEQAKSAIAALRRQTFPRIGFSAVDRRVYEVTDNEKNLRTEKLREYTHLRNQYLSLWGSIKRSNNPWTLMTDKLYGEDNVKVRAEEDKELQALERKMVAARNEYKKMNRDLLLKASIPENTVNSKVEKQRLAEELANRVLISHMNENMVAADELNKEGGKLKKLTMKMSAWRKRHPYMTLVIGVGLVGGAAFSGGAAAPLLYAAAGGWAAFGRYATAVSLWDNIRDRWVGKASAKPVPIAELGNMGASERKAAEEYNLELLAANDVALLEQQPGLISPSSNNWEQMDPFVNGGDLRGLTADKEAEKSPEKALEELRKAAILDARDFELVRKILDGKLSKGVQAVLQAAYLKWKAENPADAIKVELILRGSKMAREKLKIKSVDHPKSAVLMQMRRKELVEKFMVELDKDVNIEDRIGRCLDIALDIEEKRQTKTEQRMEWLGRNKVKRELTAIGLAVVPMGAMGLYNWWEGFSLFGSDTAAEVVTPIPDLPPDIAQQAADWTLKIPNNTDALAVLGDKDPGLWKVIAKPLDLSADELKTVSEKWFPKMAELNGRESMAMIYDNENLKVPQGMLADLAKMKGMSIGQVEKALTFR